jgi:hypothetical protein
MYEMFKGSVFTVDISNWNATNKCLDECCHSDEDLIKLMKLRNM